MLLQNEIAPIVLVRGGGDLASGVALRLVHAGFRVVVTELPQPLVVRRMASFAQAIFNGRYTLEDVEGVLVESIESAIQVMNEGKVAVIVDPKVEIRNHLPIYALVDARMMKSEPDLSLDCAPRVIGLGPGFFAGKNCHVVVETNRGPFLGRLYWQGRAEEDTGIPESVTGFGMQRVLYAPKDGIFQAKAIIGQILEDGDLIAEVNGSPIVAHFRGVLRGLIFDGLYVHKGLKVGDLDPRCNIDLCTLASDKALAVGGGVLEALLSNRYGEEL